MGVFPHGFRTVFETAVDVVAVVAEEGVVVVVGTGVVVVETVEVVAVEGVGCPPAHPARRTAMATPRTAIVRRIRERPREVVSGFLNVREPRERAVHSRPQSTLSIDVTRDGRFEGDITTGTRCTKSRDTPGYERDTDGHAVSDAV
ncbi:MAG: hypothetical protein ABEJ67_05710 [Halanaeroarchaeum sp.]